MLQNDTILTLQYEWEEQMMENEKSNEGSLKKVQDLITAIKSTYYFSSLLTMSETEFDEWFEENKLLVLTYNAKAIYIVSKKAENYVQVPSVSDENITSGLLHFGFNGEILVAMLKWILEKGAPVVVQEGVKKF